MMSDLDEGEGVYVDPYETGIVSDTFAARLQLQGVKLMYVLSPKTKVSDIGPLKKLGSDNINAPCSMKTCVCDASEVCNSRDKDAVQNVKVKFLNKEKRGVTTSISNVAQAEIKVIFGSMTFTEALTSQDEVNQKAMKKLNQDFREWGVYCTRLEILNISPL